MYQRPARHPSSGHRCAHDEPPEARALTPPSPARPPPPPGSETYQYYTLPFCQPQSGKRYVIEDLGEVLEGDRLVSTPYQIKFLQDAADQELCAQNLTAQDLERLRYAVANDYYFQVRRAHAWGGVGGVHAVRGCAGPGPGAALAQRLLGAGPALPY